MWNIHSDSGFICAKRRLYYSHQLQQQKKKNETIFKSFDSPRVHTSGELFPLKHLFPLTDRFVWRGCKRWKCRWCGSWRTKRRVCGTNFAQSYAYSMTRRAWNKDERLWTLDATTKKHTNLKQQNQSNFAYLNSRNSKHHLASANPSHLKIPWETLLARAQAHYQLINRKVAHLTSTRSLSLPHITISLSLSLCGAPST